jgi:hypothetical protein
VRIEREVLERLAEEASLYYSPVHEYDPIKRKERHLDRPFGLLKHVQGLINRVLCQLWKPPDVMFGGVAGRCARDNAKRHCGARVVGKIDIRDYYPSITADHVYRALMREVGCSREIGMLLTRLLTVNNHLPQGGPASTTVANMVLAPYAAELEAAVTPIGVAITDFVDDVGLSGDRTREAVEIAVKLLGRYGFFVKPTKVKVMTRGRRSQNLTGYNLEGEEPSVNRRTRHRWREMALRAGRDLNTPKHVLATLRGRALFLRTARPEQEPAMTRLLDRVVVVEGTSEPKGKPIRRPCECDLGKGLGRAVPGTPEPLSQRA